MKYPTLNLGFLHPRPLDNKSTGYKDPNVTVKRAAVLPSSLGYKKVTNASICANND